MSETGWWRAVWQRLWPHPAAAPARPAGELGGQLTALTRERDEAVQAAAEARQQAGAAQAELDRLRSLAGQGAARTDQAHHPPEPEPGTGTGTGPASTPTPAVAAGPAADPDELAGLPRTAKELVAITDRLTDIVRAGPMKDPQRATTVIQWVNTTIHDLLARSGVVAIEDHGLVDPRRHEVVDVRPAPNPELTDHIAETVQPGYELHGTLIRAQRVIAYTEPAAAAHRPGEA